MSNHEEIKNNILEQIQKIKEEKLLNKNAKRNAKKAISEEKKKIEEEKKFLNYQEKYRSKKRDDGIHQVLSFLHSKHIEKIDNFIIENAKQKIKLNRSDVIAQAIENFFPEDNNGDTPK